MNDALRSLAERLAKACPVRFEFYEGLGSWRVLDHGRDEFSAWGTGHFGVAFASVEIEGLTGMYAFWGPLWEALPFATPSRTEHNTADLKIAHCLDKIATQVVEHFEAKAGEGEE